MANEFLGGRVAVDSFTLVSSGANQTVVNGVNIPGGVLVTGVTYMDAEARTVAGGGATYQPCVINTGLSKTQYFVSTLNVSDFPAQTIVTCPPLLTAGGVYIASPGQLGVVLVASNAAITFSPTVYVGYIDIDA
jgi:hypothetical protein